MYGEQLWIRDGWYARFNRRPDQNETGVRHSFTKAGEFRVPDIRTLLDYHRSVMDVMLEYLCSLTESELDTEFEASYTPGATASVHRRIIGNINECFQHIGQAAHVRGLLEGQGWLGR